VPEGTVVTVTGTLTAVDTLNAASTKKFYLQDKSASQYGGLYVFFGSTSLPADVIASNIGKKFTVTGTYQEWFDQTQISNTTSVTMLADLADPIAPISVPVGDINNSGSLAEPYEGMLVSISDLVVTNSNPDAPSDDFGEMEVTENITSDIIRIDDDLYDGVEYVRTLSTPYSIITGIAVYTHSNRKVIPRDENDIN
jgi:predicted extracellular nuclease